MAYASDDPRPQRRTLGQETQDVGFNIPHTVSDDDPTGGDHPECDAMCDVAAETIPSTRAGDDAPRPARPSNDVLKRILAEREKDRPESQEETIVNGAVANADDVSANDQTSESDKGRSIKKLIVYSCSLLFGLWVCNVFYSVIRNVLVAQTVEESALAIGLLVITIGVFAFIVIYAWSLFSGLPSIESISESDFRTNTYKLMETIRSSYLAHFPAHEAYAKILRLPNTDDLTQSLKVLRTREYSDSKSFLVDFKGFQQLQDQRAVAVIRKYILLIAVKTAASPWRIVDMMAVFFNSTLMICEVASIYNRRMSRAHAFRLMIGWMMNLYISGEIGRLMDGTTDALNDNLGDLIGSDGLGALVQPFLPLFSKFVGKVAEGGVNAYLAYRLGKRSIVAFRYLKLK